MPNKTVWLETYGCQMNKAESESMLLALREAGWTEGDSDREADLVILNTCSVRETAEERVRGRLGFYRHAKSVRPFTLVLAGCMAERLKERILDEHPEIDVILGTFQKQELIAAVERSRRGQGPVVAAEARDYEFASQHSRQGLKAFVPIMHGCDNGCSYCIVPRVRGPEVSRPPREIHAEIESAVERGVQEITLLGQNVNSYRWEAGSEMVDFPRLLDQIATRPLVPRWVRFLTSHPKDLSDELLSVLAQHPVFCRHIHLPLQSGSNRILRLMNRGYTREHYDRLVDRVRRALSGTSLTTDILIGFPGETEDDFQETLRMVERVRFDDAFTYYYNPREGTPAYTMADPVPEATRLERLARVIEAQRAASERAARSRLGREVQVLVEGVSKKNAAELLARTEWDAMVVFPGDRSLIGHFVLVRLLTLSGNTYRAQMA